MFGAAPGPRARRLVARGIDDGLVLAIQVAFVLPAVVLQAVADDSHRDEVQLTVVGFVLLATGWVVSVCYEVASTHLGGGPGKRVLQLRVVTAEGAVLPVRASIARWALVTGVQPLVWCAVGVVWSDWAVVRVLGAALVTGSLAWRAALAVSILRGDGSTGWHDRRIGSRVVPPHPDEVTAAGDLPGDDLPADADGPAPGGDDRPSATVPR
ncbi:MAG TPA: RDD family protein [Acidimicrobiales bacterium]